MKAEALRRPLSIDQVRDGGLYTFDPQPLTQTNLFLRVGRVDDVFVKTPSPDGLEQYRTFILPGKATPDDTRAPDDAEPFDRLDDTLGRFPALQPVAALDREIAHYVLIHKLQHERLRLEPAVSVPDARFAVRRVRRLFPTYEPIFFQARVPGTTLWEMFDFDVVDVRPAWQPFVPMIAAQLSKLIDSPSAQHVDWNIKNFVFRETDQRLFYVDLKPTTFVARHGNEHNLQGIRDYFLP